MPWASGILLAKLESLYCRENHFLSLVCVIFYLAPLYLRHCVPIRVTLFIFTRLKKLKNDQDDLSLMLHFSLRCLISQKPEKKK